MTERTPERKPATTHTTAAQSPFLARVARGSSEDFEIASRGLIASGSPRVVKNGFDVDVWDLDSYAFLDEPSHVDAPPTTVNPSLWRQGRLNNIAGLFEVAPSIYQVRGMDISNVTFIKGDTGWIVIDPLSAKETAAAALDMVNEHLGSRPVHAVIYTHSHADHFGGVLGVLSEEEQKPDKIKFIAPEGFLEEAVSENIIAGNAMIRRAMYMYGVLLPRDAQGHVDTGLGKGMPRMPSSALIAPNLYIEKTGTELVIDGVRMIFQLTPGSEAPAEMNIFFPDMRALCMAENCTATLHNIYTPRGAQIRDTLNWSKYIDESIDLYAQSSDVVFASHHWPRWGAQKIVSFLESQRDTYRYIHDQTLRLANLGHTMNEIAEELELPKELGDEFFNRDYYGTVSHNAKGVYQRYLGWFDANPAHLNPHIPVEAAKRYVAFMGGADAVMQKAQKSFDEGDYRWVVEVVNHVVFADPENETARLFQADALEQLGYQSESGPWRDFYLSGAQELRSNGTMFRNVKSNALRPGFLHAMTTGQVFDLIGVRLNAPRAQSHSLRFHLTITDRNEQWTFGVRNGVLQTHVGHRDAADATISATFEAFAQFASKAEMLSELSDQSGTSIAGDSAKLELFLTLLDYFTFGFEIVLP